MYFNPHEREARDDFINIKTSPDYILIHTSVKLVTPSCRPQDRRPVYFNPHEREARDGGFVVSQHLYKYFNPHEREARDAL